MATPPAPAPPTLPVGRSNICNCMRREQDMMGDTPSGGRQRRAQRPYEARAPSDVTRRPQRPDEAIAPYDVSLTFVAAVAFLAPLATILWALHDTVGDEFDIHHRHLQITCNVTNSSIAQANAEEVSTIDAIRTTSIIAASVAFLCLLGYELFRQDPIVGKYVYDRKRLTQPGRTPPPLMLSRSLWRGDGEGRSCCRVFPALLELVFINLDRVYVQYSETADEARKERERRGHYTCCRTGCYHNNCCNTVRFGNARSAESEETDYYTDEDGYVFYAGYDNEYSHIYQGNTQSFSPKKKPHNLQLSASEASESGEAMHSPRWKKNIADLYPEDGTRHLLANLPGEDTDSDDGSAESAENEESSFLTANSIEAGEIAEVKRESNNHIHEADDDQTPAKSALVPDNDSQGAKGEGVGDENGAEDDTTRPPYPYRLKYLVMPPGFHTWENFFKFLGNFFFLLRCVPWFHDCTSGGGESGSRPSVLEVDVGKELTGGEAKLLEYAGLDTYLLIRFARFGFDVTCYPFFAACIVILPVYYSCSDESGFYFNLTINEVPDGSPKIVAVVVFTIILYIYILRRLWLEWEVFIRLRHQYLANGDRSFFKSRSHQRKYRNSCIVECIPESHRSDQNLNLVFEKLFPGQIESAEMFIDTSKLESTLRQRRKVIEKYDDLYARHEYQKHLYSVWEQEGKKVGGCCNNKIAKPTRPQVRTGRFSREKEDAYDYFNKKIQEVDATADTEYADIVSARQKLVGVSILDPSKSEDANASRFSRHDIYQLLVPSRVRMLFGEGADFFYGTGVVTFKTIAAKQSAVQCNLSGLPYFMITSDAPDPRDVFWKNVGVSRVTLENRKILVQFLLLLGVLAWGSIVTLIHSFTLQVFGTIPFGGFGATLVQGYLPALVVSLVLLWIPNLFFALARHVVRFKSHTQCDEFTLLWNTCYRLANIFFTFFSISFLQALQCLRENPEDFVVTLADGIIRQSAFLMNLIILATGQETMLQLLQWRSLIKQAAIRPLVNVNARSRRYLDWLNAAPEFEKSFIFGFFAPVLSYGLMIALVFAFMAPIMLFVCGIFFWVATKVHTHNALFVYCQRCEGGGSIFYYWSRIVFITLYCSVIVFAGILALKKYTTTGIVFFFVMTLGVYCVDRAVKNTFVVHSLHLPISIARIHDDDEAAHLLEEAKTPGEEESQTKLGGGAKFMYRHPLLNQDNWNSKPTWS